MAWARRWRSRDSSLMRFVFEEMAVVREESSSSNPVSLALSESRRACAASDAFCGFY